MLSYYECKQEFLLYVRSYAAVDTVKYYNINFRIFEKYLEVREYDMTNDFVFCKSDYVDYQTYLRGQNIRNTSVRTYMRAIKSFLRWLYFEGYALENVTERVKQPKPDKRQILPLTDSEVLLLDAYFGEKDITNRNKSIMYLMLECGLRLGEVCRLDYGDIDFSNYCIYIRDSKNNKSRTVPLTYNVWYNLTCYWNSREDTLECAFADYRGLNRLTENAIKTIYSRAKVIVPRVHAHLFRHTFATSYVMQGGNLEILRILMGHDSYNVTKDYLHISTQSQICKRSVYQIPDNMIHVFRDCV